METFPPSQLPPAGAGPVPILLSLLFLLPYPGTWGVSCLLGSLTSSASVQWVFCRNSSACRCISDVSVGRKVISTSYSSAILKLLSPAFVPRHSLNVSLFLPPSPLALCYYCDGCMRSTFYGFTFGKGNLKPVLHNFLCSPYSSINLILVTLLALLLQ